MSCRTLILAIVATATILARPIDAAAQTSAQRPTTPAQQPATPPSAATDPDPHGTSAMRTEGLPDEQARSRFRVGQTLYLEGRYREAAREFEHGYELSHRPVLLYNAYLAYRDAGELENAIRVLDLYLTEQPNAEDADVLRRRLAAMRTSHERDLEADRDAQAERERLEAERQRLATEADERRAADEREAAERAARQHRARGPLILIASGGALLLGAGVSALIVNARQNDLESECPDHLCPLGTDIDSVQSSIRTPAITTDVLLGSGVITVVAGLIWFGSSRKHARTDAPPPVTAACGRNGCDFHYRLSF